MGLDAHSLNNPRSAAAAVGPPPGAESVEGITVGSRCEVRYAHNKGLLGNTFLFYNRTSLNTLLFAFRFSQGVAAEWCGSWVRRPA